MVAGEARGRRLQAPPGSATRPTSDYVREAIFNALGSRGGVEGASVLDLFAGSGALGIEALSQGAARVTFVEHDRNALIAIRANLEHVRMADRASVVRAEAVGWLATADPVDVALVDPPYDFSRWDEVLERLDAGLAVLESDRELDLGERWEGVRIKRYGTTVVTLAERHGLQGLTETV